MSALSPVTPDVLGAPLPLEDKLSFPVTDFGARPSDTFDNRSAILRAIDKASVKGGIVWLPRGTIGFTGEILLPDGVGLRALGHGGTSPFKSASILKCLDAGAHLQFGAKGAGSYCPSSGGFRVDANGLATSPLRVGRTVGTVFSDIQVNGAAAGGTGILIQEAQNCVFMAVRAENCAGDGWTIDGGAGGHTFIVCNAANFGRYAVVLTQSYATPALYLYPSSNTFIGSVWEAPLGGALGCVKHEAGYENVMIRCNLVSTLGTLLEMTNMGGSAVSSDLTLEDCVLFGDPAVTTAIKMGTTGERLILRGKNRIHGHLFGYNLPGLAYLLEDANTSWVAVGTKATGAFAASIDALWNPAVASAAAQQVGGFIKMAERVGPPVAPADGAYIFCRDNGAGKTQICVQFASGAVQVVATQP